MPLPAAGPPCICIPLTADCAPEYWVYHLISCSPVPTPRQPEPAPKPFWHSTLPETDTPSPTGPAATRRRAKRSSMPNVPFLLEKEGRHIAVDYRLTPHQKTRNLTRFRAEINTNAEMYLLSVEDFREKENYHIVPVYAGFCV